MVHNINNIKGCIYAYKIYKEESCHLKAFSMEKQLNWIITWLIVIWDTVLQWKYKYQIHVEFQIVFNAEVQVLLQHYYRHMLL